MDEKNIIIVSDNYITIISNNYCYGAVIYIDPEIWEGGEKWYRFDIVKQKDGKIINTVMVDYATSPGDALTHAIDEIK